RLASSPVSGVLLLRRRLFFLEAGAHELLALGALQALLPGLGAARFLLLRRRRLRARGGRLHVVTSVRRIGGLVVGVDVLALEAGAHERLALLALEFLRLRFLVAIDHALLLRCQLLARSSHVCREYRAATERKRRDQRE